MNNYGINSPKSIEYTENAHKVMQSDISCIFCKFSTKEMFMVYPPKPNYKAGCKFQKQYGSEVIKCSEFQLDINLRS